MIWQSDASQDAWLCMVVDKTRARDLGGVWAIEAVAVAGRPATTC